MSPARPRRGAKNQHALHRDQREVRIAVSACVALVLGTFILIWAMRPGGATTAIYGNGGILSRQPRVGLYLLVLLALVGVVVSVARRPGKEDQAKKVFTIGLPVVAVIAVVGGIVWPGGLIRDYLPRPTLPDINLTTTTAVPGATTTTAAGATTTTAVAGATTTTAAGATTTTAAAPAVTTTIAPTTTSNG